MLKDAIDYVLERFGKAVKLDDGRVFLEENGHVRYCEKEPHPTLLPMTRTAGGERLYLGSVASLIDFTKAMHEKGFSAPRITVTIAEGGGQRIEALWRPFDTITSTKKFQHEYESVVVPLCFWGLSEGLALDTFLAFLDDHEYDFIDNEVRDQMRTACRKLRFQEVKEITFEDRGAYYTTKTMETKGVETDGLAIPSQFEMILPAGTYEFKPIHKFRLRIHPEKKIYFLRLTNVEDVMSRFMDECIEQLHLAVGLPTDVKAIILEGPR